MAKKIIKAQMKQRLDTLDNWAGINPVLLEGELGFVSDDPNLYKIGDGINAWNDLPFRGFDGTLAQDIGTSTNSAISQKAATLKYLELGANIVQLRQYVEGSLAEIESGLDTLKQTISEDIATKLETKADKIGYAPKLTSGFASNLVGRGESTESEFSFRASGGKSIEDGAARISELRGNGVVWNQGLKYALSQADSGKNGWWSRYTSNGLAQLDGRKVTFFAGDGNTPSIAQACKIVKGHTYLISFDFTTEYTDPYRRAYLFSFAGDAYGSTAQQTYSPQDGLTSGHRDSFVVARDNYSYFIWSVSKVDLSSTPASTATLENYQLIDLTLMFGAGNEPTTIEEFNARKPIGVDEYAYNEGTLIPFNADAIKSVGFNAWDEELTTGYYDESGRYITDSTIFMSKNAIKVLPNTRYFISSSKTSYINAYCAFFDARGNFITRITNGFGYALTTPSNAHTMIFSFSKSSYGATYNNDICIHLVHTGYRNGEYQPYENFTRQIDPRIKEAFPNGMKLWDKVYNKNGKGYIVKGTVVVDLGTLSYSVGGSTNGTPRMVSSVIPSIAVTEPTNVANIVCSKYVANTANNVYMNNIGIAVLRTGELSIYDPSYTDAATFKAAMQGVMLWCELAEPEVIEYDEPFNLDYEVWDFGTEEILSEQPSAPISADIIYQFNAVDTIRNNQIEIAELKAMIATMQAQMASMASNEDVIE